MDQQPVLLSEYQPPSFLMSSVDLAFDLDPAATRVSSRLALRRNPEAQPDQPLCLNGEAVTLVRIARDGVPLVASDARRIEDGVSDHRHRMPDSCMLEIETQIAPAENTELSAGYMFPEVAISPSARRKVFAASHTSPTVPT